MRVEYSIIRYEPFFSRADAVGAAVIFCVPKEKGSNEIEAYAVTHPDVVPRVKRLFPWYTEEDIVWFETQLESMMHRVRNIKTLDEMNQYIISRANGLYPTHLMVAKVEEPIEEAFSDIIEDALADPANIRRKTP